MSIAPEPHFSPDYFEARERFFGAAEACGARLESHPMAALSLGGESLSIDVAYLGPEAPRSVIAMSSGLHGAEGFAGSAIQHHFLAKQWSGFDLPADGGVLLVHALNPFGFSAVRRVNESNVDLNRNFLQHPDGHAPNPGYEELYDAINPQTLDEAADLAQRGALLEYAQKHGFPKLQEVLTVGQYVHPEGVQFGGQEPEESNRLLREIAAEQTRGASRVAWIDFHTGLGPWGEVEMILESPADTPDFARATAWWGNCVRSTADGESVSAAVHGSIRVGLAESLPEAELTAVGAEFGTHDPARVFAAMRADNWLHQHGELESEQGVAIKRELLEVFRPEAPGWGARVLEVGAGLIDQARQGLQGGA
jgi:predicted deacylase